MEPLAENIVCGMLKGVHVARKCLTVIRCAVWHVFHTVSILDAPYYVTARLRPTAADTRFQLWREKAPELVSPRSAEFFDGST